MNGLLLAGAFVFGVGKALRPRTARRLWLACGVGYVALACVHPGLPAAGLETALGASFVGAAYALERLERLGQKARLTAR